MLVPIASSRETYRGSWAWPIATQQSRVTVSVPKIPNECCLNSPNGVFRRLNEKLYDAVIVIKYCTESCRVVFDFQLMKFCEGVSIFCWSECYTAIVLTQGIFLMMIVLSRHILEN
jgi:hypothetical protein